MIKFILFLFFLLVKEFLTSYSFFFFRTRGFYGIIKGMHTNQRPLITHPILYPDLFFIVIFEGLY